VSATPSQLEDLPEALFDSSELIWRNPVEALPQTFFRDGSNLIDNRDHRLASASKGDEKGWCSLGRGGQRNDHDGPSVLIEDVRA
jgi:hypothetical protein